MTALPVREVTYPRKPGRNSASIHGNIVVLIYKIANQLSRIALSFEMISLKEEALS